MRLRAAELALAGLPVRIGAGATPLLASYAARCAAPVLVVRDPAGFLAPLPLAFAEPTPGQEGILRAWGIGTLGALSALPKAEVGRRLGAEGVLLWERAAGEATRVLRHVEPARSFAAEWAYEPPVESIEPLFFKLRRFAERIALELRGAGLVAEKLSLTLLLEDGSDHRREFRLPEPGADVEGWLRVLHSHLGDVRTDARVAGVRLVAAPARPPQRQESLFDTCLRDPASFWENIARIAAIVGDDRVGTPVPADTHRPDAFVLERPAEAVAPPAGPPVHPAARARPAPVPPAVARARRLRGGIARPPRGGAPRGPGERGARPLAFGGRLVEAGGVGRRDLAGRAGRGGRLPAGERGGRLVRRGDAGLAPPQGRPHPCRTSNSMREARSPSCAPARSPRPSSPRRPGSGCRPWRCATATASTGPSGSTSAGGRPACGPLSAASSRWRTAASCRSSSRRARATAGCAAC